MRLDHFWPPRKKQIAYQQRLLAMHRRILQAYLTERAQWPTSDIPLVLRSAIRGVRENIYTCKGLLRGWNVAVLDEAADSDSGDDDFTRTVAHQRGLLQIHRKHLALIEQRFAGYAQTDIPAHVLLDVSSRQQEIEQITALLRGWNVSEEGVVPITTPF